MRRTRIIMPLVATAATAAGVVTSGGVASAASPPGTYNVLAGLNGPRGVVHIDRNKTLISLADGTLRLAQEHRSRAATVTTLTAVGAGDFGLDQGPHHTTWLLTGGAAPDAPGGPPAGAATLYKWKKATGKPAAVANIAAYQAKDPDPYALPHDDPATASNPYGVKALANGSVLVTDAANNDVLHVSKDGVISTVARLKPRMVQAPGGKLVPSEAVPTSVAVGPGGYWYVGELRGGPGTAGTSQIWRIKPGSTNAVCDPAKPNQGDCRRYADGLSAIVGLDSYRKGPLYAVSLSKAGLAGVEGPTPDLVGGVYRVRSGAGRSVAVAPGHRFLVPGGVSVARNRLYVTDHSLLPKDGRLVSIPR